MPPAPRNDNRVFREPLTVRCPTCGREATLSTPKRNDHKHPGHYCDGPAMDHRHPLRQMLGPEGKGWA